MPFIDFAAIKEIISFAETIDLLQLNLKVVGNQWRGPCPACQNGGDRALVVTEGKGFFCFSMKKGGDQIALASHILGLAVKDAAQELAHRAGIAPVQGTINSTGTVPRTAPQSERGQETQKLRPLTYLECDHEAVIAVGFDPVKAKAMGIGYSPRGLMRGTVAIPIRDEHGTLLGYIGVTEAKLPSDFMSNVVALKRA